MSVKHAAIVLAAGASRRMRQPKQLIRIDGEALLRRAACAALATLPTRVLIVTGAYAEKVFAVVADLAVERIDCADWNEGMAASLRAGLDALHDEDGDGALVLLCDQPDLNTEHLQALCATWRTDPTRAAASAYAGTLGVPALLPRAWFADLRVLHGDRGARDLLRARVDRVTALPAPALARDLDTPDDLG